MMKVFDLRQLYKKMILLIHILAIYFETMYFLDPIYGSAAHVIYFLISFFHPLFISSCLSFLLYFFTSLFIFFPLYLSSSLSISPTFLASVSFVQPAPCGISSGTNCTLGVFASVARSKLSPAHGECLRVRNFYFVSPNPFVSRFFVMHSQQRDRQ